MSQHYLRHLFAPRAIAVFGASDDQSGIGGRVFLNLRQAGFKGPVYPVNPEHKEVAGIPCHANLDGIRDPIDLAVIAAPAKAVAQIMRDCGNHGVRAAIIISAGFSEGGPEGQARERAVLDIARQHGIRVLGPNCLGLMNPARHLNATFSKNAARPGHLALVSQSGALCTSILDWADARAIGFSALVSIGDAADVDFGDVLDYLAQDPHTRSILLYVEGIRHARSFMSGLRAAARLKPVVVLKAGRHGEASRAAVTHTAAMIGADAVFDAALQRAGVVRVLTVDQLFAAAELLATPCRTRGNALAIITNGGGMGVMAADRCMDLGIKLAALSDATVATLDRTLPAHWSRANPVDLLGDATPERYRAATAACLADPGVDGILVMLSPQAMTDAGACARAVIDAAAGTDKPVMACWMGAAHVQSGIDLFAAHHLPHFSSPETAVEAFHYLGAYYQNQQQLMQVPGPLAADSAADVAGARLIIQSVLGEGRTLLDAMESRAVLHAFAIPATPCIHCRTANEALVAAESLGFPVAMKIHSHDITHKSDVGGVRLNIANAQAVRAQYEQLLAEVQVKAPDARLDGVTIEPMYGRKHGRELMIGVVRDPVFGPAISFGAGGVDVEFLRDSAVALPPLNTRLIERLIDRTRVAGLLGEHRGMPPVDHGELVQALRRISELVCEIPELDSLDINPLVADQQGVLALDVRITVSRPEASLDPYSHMAIHPYPAHLVSRLQLDDGTDLVIRPIRPEDAAIEKSFVDHLSPQTRYFRFMEELKELTQEMLVRFTQLDYDRELALIAVLPAATGSGKEAETEVGVARYLINPDGDSCEFALVVADAWQGRGIGTRLMQALMEAARQRGLEELNGEVLSNNAGMLTLVKDLGFMIETSGDDPGVKVVRRAL